ncbi:MAG TPA: hypothetical protein HPP65_12455 [Gammaproteobacteria bacterium]|nr:hypothetical protein [Gammaproteobacteria bacterium]MBT3719214.1 hypothetical protein [Gammaproteobacteria bacterium]MBT3844989.1 hypothetical protein [Gammaproteobacteria bacterium]MBT4302083.1 hypothetical protein [Gammaproteobacteria bacterium]MBT6651138.1 hypothetical protein [Gammaproteobacteria bacterium]
MNLFPPFLEHLSFRMGNQLFFVRLEDVDAGLVTPGNDAGYKTLAKESNGHAVVMPMRKGAGEWKADGVGLGLIDPDTREAVDPVALVSDEEVEMSDWELHDFAIQVVRHHIEDELKQKLMSFQVNPAVHPALWFVGDHGPEWVVVFVARYPQQEAFIPENIEEIAESCAQTSTLGSFASVTVANADDEFDPRVPALPL